MDGILDSVLAISENIDLSNVATIIFITLISSVALIFMCGGLFTALVKWVRKIIDKEKSQQHCKSVKTD